jgi:leucyl aminopeptidase (aminopeptidase T)
VQRESLRKAAKSIVSKIAAIRKGHKVLVICGAHNEAFGETIFSESLAVGAFPFFWVFDESLFLRGISRLSQEVLKTVPDNVRCLLAKSDAVVWLSQFDDLERFSVKTREALCGFWNQIYEIAKAKPLLLINLPSAKFVRDLRIGYSMFLETFARSLNVDHSKLREIGHTVEAKIKDKSLAHVRDENGTDLTFNTTDRRVGVEVASLMEYWAGGGESVMDVPAGEVYVAPVETSANGLLIVDEIKEYGVVGLKLRFKKGKISNFEAEKGIDSFKKIMERAKSSGRVLGEFGVGINHGMKPVGWSIYDEKALGTVHVAIGNNMHLGGTNDAPIHLDFVLYHPTVNIDDELIMKKGRLIR